MHLYEYAVIRFVPKVERGEFINVGLLLYCKSTRQIYARFHVNLVKFEAFQGEISLDELNTHLAAFEAIAKGKNGGVVGTYERAERFRWLTAVKSSCIQAARPHPGRAIDIEKEFNRLFHDLVM